MDIFAHGLWAGAAYKAINKKTKKTLNTKLAVFWGIFPDLFSFTLVFAWLFGNLIVSHFIFSDLPQHEKIGLTQQDALPILRLTSMLYNISHSAIVFLVIFGVIFLVLRRLVWELGGWFLHILIDIPTHSYQFYPTPFLWPLSKWKFNGFSWGTLWFLIPNYTAIIVVYLLLRRKKLDTTKQ